MSGSLRVGISTCPNDTFLFHPLLEGAIDTGGLALEITLADVQELNERFLAGELDVAKISFHAALQDAATSVVLPVGAALGRGVGPVCLSGQPGAPPDDPRVLCPGEWTTATLLWRLFHPAAERIEQVVFSAIPEGLRAGRADLGVCIHEARFTYAREGLHLVEDLGATWERTSGEALPLGGLVARRSLGAATLGRLTELLGASLDAAREAPEETLPTMRRHAQAFEDDVLFAHVELYVTDATRDLGAAGRRSLDALSALAAERGLVPSGARLEVL